MADVNYKQLEEDGQMVKAVQTLTERGMTASEIVEKGYLGLKYEQVDRIRQKYLKSKRKAATPLASVEDDEIPKKGGRFSIEE